MAELQGNLRWLAPLIGESVLIAHGSASGSLTVALASGDSSSSLSSTVRAQLVRTSDKAIGDMAVMTTPRRLFGPPRCKLCAARRNVNARAGPRSRGAKIVRV